MTNRQSVSGTVSRHGGALRHILRSEASMQWRDELVKVFFDRDSKRDLIHRVRQEVSQQANVQKLDQHERDELLHTLVAKLCAEASTQVSTLASPVPALRRGAALTRDVTEHYPYPIARAYFIFAEARTYVGKFISLLDVVEVALHYLGMVAVSAYVRAGCPNRKWNDRLFRLLTASQRWSLGRLLEILRGTIKYADDFRVHLPFEELPGHLFKHGNPTMWLKILDSFIEVRNAVHHGGEHTEELCRRLFQANGPRIEQELAQLAFLKDWTLIRPWQIDEGCPPKVTKAMVLMGPLLLEPEKFVVELNPADSDLQSSESLLLVGPGTAERRSCLPLYPLCAYLIRLNEETPDGIYNATDGVYFLEGASCTASADDVRVDRTYYKAYDSRLPKQAEKSHNDASQNLKRLLLKLHDPASFQNKNDREETYATANIEEDLDDVLDVLRAEQKRHRMQFVGREQILKDISKWIAADTTDGHCLLLVGPPGQGKSALAAELASREQRGCLLHMIKIDRRPQGFLPLLTRQAADILQTRFGDAWYQGGIEEQRKRLMRAAKALVECKEGGRALILIDALDELEETRHGLEFLPWPLPKGVRVVATCRHDPRLMRALRAWRQVGVWPQGDRLDVPPLGYDEFERLAANRLGVDAWHKLEDSPNWSECFERLGGNPLLLQRALDQVHAELLLADDEDRKPCIRGKAIHDSLDDVFAEDYDHIAGRSFGQGPSSEENEHRARLLQFLAVAREPLDCSQLAGLMRADGLEITQDDCRNRVAEMGRFLLNTNGREFEPWHQGFVDFIRNSILNEHDSRKTERVFCRWLRSTDTTNQLYAMRHLLDHLEAAGPPKELAVQLADSDFVERCCEEGEVGKILAGLAKLVSATSGAGHNQR